MAIERRKSKRFNTGDSDFAAFIRPNEPVIVGKIVDISQQGLAVRYLASGKLGEGTAEVRIFGPNLGPTGHIKCKVVYDQILAEESWDAFLVRRCGVKFSLVSQFDSAKLRALMKMGRNLVKSHTPINFTEGRHAAV
jgi:hypothetical protein